MQESVCKINTQVSSPFFGTVGRALILALVIGTSVGQAAGPPVVKNVPLTPEMKVDGLITDWVTLTSVTKEVSVAAANNNDRLVLAIATSDPSVKQRLLMAGLIVYFDPKGKKGKTYGVRIPAAGGGAGMPGRGGRSGAPPDPGAAPPSDPASQPPPIAYLQVLGPAENESHNVDLGGTSGYEAVRGNNQGTLLIEVAIPLRVGDGITFVAPITPSQTAIGLGLETPDVRMPGRGSGEDGRGGGGGRSGGGAMGGGMGRGGGGMGGPPGGGQRPGGGQGKALKMWTTMELAPRSS